MSLWFRYNLRRRNTRDYRHFVPWNESKFLTRTFCLLKQSAPFKALLKLYWFIDFLKDEINFASLVLCFKWNCAVKEKTACMWYGPDSVTVSRVSSACLLFENPSVVWFQANEVIRGWRKYCCEGTTKFQCRAKTTTLSLGIIYF